MFLLVAFSILLVKIYATSKKLLVAKKLQVDPWLDMESREIEVIDSWRV